MNKYDVIEKYYDTPAEVKSVGFSRVGMHLLAVIQEDFDPPIGVDEVELFLLKFSTGSTPHPVDAVEARRIFCSYNSLNYIFINDDRHESNPYRIFGFLLEEILGFHTDRISVFYGAVNSIEILSGLHFSKRYGQNSLYAEASMSYAWNLIAQEFER